MSGEGELIEWVVRKDGSEDRSEGKICSPTLPAQAQSAAAEAGVLGKFESLIFWLHLSSNSIRIEHRKNR